MALSNTIGQPSPVGTNAYASGQPPLPPIPPARQAAIRARMNELGLSRESLPAAAPGVVAPVMPVSPRRTGRPLPKGLLLWGLVGLGVIWLVAGPPFRSEEPGTGPLAPHAASRPAGTGEGPGAEPVAGLVEPRVNVSEVPPATVQGVARSVPPAAAPASASTSVAEPAAAPRGGGGGDLQVPRPESQAVSRAAAAPAPAGPESREPAEARTAASSGTAAARSAPDASPERAAEAPWSPPPAASRPAYPAYPGYTVPYAWTPQPYYPYGPPGRSQ